MRRSTTLQKSLDVSVGNLKSEGHVAAFSCEVTGRYAVLADVQGLTILDLEYPYQQPRVLHHQTKAKVVCVRCSPHYMRKDYVASTSHSNVLIWRVDDDYRPLVAGLRKHSRPVKDLGWSPNAPDVVATGALDGMVYLWDTRAHQAPCQSFSAGPNKPLQQLVWNKQNPSLLASAHDGEVHVWDTRKAGGGSARRFLVPGAGPLCSLDWNPSNDSELVTCGSDAFVRFWDVANTTEEGGKGEEGGALESLSFRAVADQVNLVRYTPFGQSGLVSVGKIKGYQAPQQEGTSRLDALYLWTLPASKTKSVESLQQVCRFEGHAAPVVAYDWRVVDSIIFQLVSLDETQQLRLWRVDAGVLRACGHVSRSESLALSEDDGPTTATATTAEGGGAAGQQAAAPAPPRIGFYDTISPSLAAKLTADALKFDLNPATVSASRPAPTATTHTAVSVWQEMVEVEELARQGGLRDVDIEMVDVMSRTMRLSVGPMGFAKDPSGLSSGPPSPHQSRAAAASGFRLLVTVEFPPSYPYGAMPKFSFRAVREDEEEEEEEEEDDDDDEDEDEEEEIQEEKEDRGEKERGGAAGGGAAGGGRGGRKGGGVKRSASDSSTGTWGEGGNTGGGSEVESPTEGRGLSRRKAPSGGGLLTQAGRELLTREVGDIARSALEAQLPCLESCIRHLERTLEEAASAGVTLITQSSSDQTAGSEEARLHFAFEGGAGGEAGMSKADGTGDASAATTTATSGRAQGANQLPCPRYGGAVFSGPNMLVLFNCNLALGGGVEDARSATTTTTGGTAKPPRTYGNLLRRASGGGPKSYLPALTPQVSGGLDAKEREEDIKGTPASSRRGSSVRFSSPDDLLQHQRRRSSVEGGAGGLGLLEGGKGGREGGGPASAAAAMRLNSPMYSMYFMSPQSRLPLNHPDHDYSLQEPMSRIGMLSSDDEGLAAAAFAQLNTQVVLLDASSLVPGNPELSVLYTLGPCQTSSTAPFFLASNTTTGPSRMPSSSSTTHVVSRSVKKSPMVSASSTYPIPSLPARRVSEPAAPLPRVSSGGALASLAAAANSGGNEVAVTSTHSTPNFNLSISPSTSGLLRRLAAEKPPSGRPASERLHASHRSVAGGGDGAPASGLVGSQGNVHNSSLQALGGAAVAGSGNGSAAGLYPPIPLTVNNHSATHLQSLRRYNSLFLEREVPEGMGGHQHRARSRLLAVDSPFTSASAALTEDTSSFRLPPTNYYGRLPQQQGGGGAVSSEDLWWKTLLADARAISKACRANARAASKVGDEELVQVWMLLYASTTACAEDLQHDAHGAIKAMQRRDSMIVLAMMDASEGEDPLAARARATRSWKQGAFGKALVESLFQYYEKVGDVQTLATIVCVLNARHPYTLLQESKRAAYDRYLHCYAELLFRWGALDLRADVLKRVSKTHAGDSFLPMDYMSIAMRCFRCSQPVDLSNFCDTCKTYPMKCIICQLAVKGQSMFCLACSHGGHTHHMQEWFSTNNVCPTGCGCRCLFSQSVHVLAPQRSGGSGGGLTSSPLAVGRGGGFVGPLSTQLSDEPIVI